MIRTKDPRVDGSIPPAPPSAKALEKASRFSLDKGRMSHSPETSILNQSSMIL